MLKLLYFTEYKQYCVQLKQPKLMADENKVQRYGQNFMAYVHSVDLHDQSYQSFHYAFEGNLHPYKNYEMRLFSQSQWPQFIKHESFDQIYKSKYVQNIEHSKSEQSIQEYDRRKKKFKCALQRAKNRLQQKYHIFGLGKASQKTQLMTQFQDFSLSFTKHNNFSSVMKPVQSQASLSSKLVKNKQNLQQNDEPIYTIFNENLYRESLSEAKKKQFQKECLKTKRNEIKILRRKQWVFSLKHKAIGTKLQLYVQLINLDSKARPLYLVSPRFTDILVNEGEGEYLFDFTTKIYPIIFRIDNQPILSPICMISMMKDLSYNSELQQNSQLVLGNQSNLDQSINLETSQTQHVMQDQFYIGSNLTLIQIANSLCLEKSQNGNNYWYEGSFSFYGESIAIILKQIKQQTKTLHQKNEKDGIFQNNPKKAIKKIKLLIQIFFKISKNVFFIAQLIKQVKSCLEEQWLG